MRYDQEQKHKHKQEQKHMQKQKQKHKQEQKQRQRVILASGSPRRRELLKKIIPEFLIVPADIEEVIDTRLPIEKAVEKLSFDKAQAVAKQYPEATIITGDSVVYIDSKVLGKPNDRADAKQMLKSLSGRSHQLITGVTVMNLNGRTITFSEIATISFKPLTDQQIEAYLDTDEPYDKAGAYAIQGAARSFVESYEGDKEAIIGLPTKKLKQVLNS